MKNQHSLTAFSNGPPSHSTCILKCNIQQRAAKVNLFIFCVQSSARKRVCADMKNHEAQTQLFSVCRDEKHKKKFQPENVTWQKNVIFAIQTSEQ